MGINIAYYIVNEKQVKQLESEDLDFDIYMIDNLTKIHEYEGSWFWRNSFGQGIKSWNPLIELICLLDTSPNNVCRELLSKDNYYPETKLSFSFYLIRPSLVKSIFEVLKKISLSDIERATEDEHLISKVINTQGYNMGYVIHKQSMVIEFMELFNAFYSAQNNNNAVILKLG